MVYKIAIAPNAFRGSLTAIQAAESIQKGFEASSLHCSTILMPLADGGDGTLDVWLRATQGKRISVPVHHPRGQQIMADFGLYGQSAMIEMAQGSGIELLKPEERNPFYTSTYGTGELIQAAIEHGATEILIGVGGSATVDGGAGCLQALGADLKDADGQPIAPGGGHLSSLVEINLKDLRQRFEHVRVQVLCDVDNPLLGKRGAAAVFGPQKGASPDMVELLEDNLAHYAEVIANHLDIRLHDMAGAGAAGGLSAGLVAGLGAEIVSGVDALIHACGYDAILAQGDINLLITGEGKLDTQSGGGKAPVGIASLAQIHQIPTIALAGAVTASPQELQEWHIAAAYSIVQQPCTLETALEHGANWLMQSIIHLANTLALKE